MRLRPRAWSRAIALAALVALATTIAVAAPGASQQGPVTVLAAASLTDVLPRVDPAARVSFGGSNQLFQQARQGFPFDVFLSASPRYTQALFAEGLVGRPVAFATNTLVLIVPRANPARIATIGDLARRPRLRLVVAGPSVPIGLYTRVALRRLGLLHVLRRTVSVEPDVKGIVGKVAVGEADAGLVYATDVRPVATSVRAIRLPRRAQPTVVYEAAIATRPREPAAARAFVRALLGDGGRRALRAAGFGLPA